jgi:hypothetical protein
MRIVLINGHVACLKTTLGYLLAPMLSLGHVTNSVLGAFVSDATAPTFQELREARYRTATAITRLYLNEGVSVVLDGTFARRAWREAIYQLADEFGVEDLVAITCVCSDPALIEQRFAYRRLASDSPDAAANHWGAYLGSIGAFEPIEGDTLPRGCCISRLTFDSGSFALRRDAILTPYAEAVALTIERLIASGRLSRPQFGLGPVAGLVNAPPAKRLIAIEGLAASGKSTQARLLADTLVRGGRRTSLFEEFCDNAIGEFLRKHNAIGDDHRVRVTQGAPSHTESLLVIGDAIAHVRAVYEARLAGAPGYEMVVADGYTWAHNSHGLALLPEEASLSLRQCVSAALAEILAPLRGVGELQQTVFL